MNTDRVIRQVLGDEVPAEGEEPCVICFTNKKKVAFNCGHMCTCIACSQQLKRNWGQCPICRGPIYVS